MTALESQIDEFLNVVHWRRNNRGSLSRRWGEDTVAVFTKWGNYRWVICGDPGQFSPKGYPTEDEAMVSLAKELLY